VCTPVQTYLEGEMFWFTCLRKCVVEAATYAVVLPITPASINVEVNHDIPLHPHHSKSKVSAPLCCYKEQEAAEPPIINSDLFSVRFTMITAFASQLQIYVP
jgi:hypothetical protein